MSRKYYTLIAFTLITLLLINVTSHAAKNKKGPNPKHQATVIKTAKEKPTLQAVPSSPVDSQQTQAPAVSEPAAGEQVNWRVIASGGGTQTVGSLILGSTIGQTAVGWTTIGSNKIHSGYWQDFSAGSCCQNRGNVDGITGPFDPIDVADVSYLVAFLWEGGPEPPCMEEGNVDNIVGPFSPVDVADLSYLVAFLWQGGPTPPPCP